MSSPIGNDNIRFFQVDSSGNKQYVDNAKAQELTKAGAIKPVLIEGAPAMEFEILPAGQNVPTLDKPLVPLDADTAGHALESIAASLAERALAGDQSALKDLKQFVNSANLASLEPLKKLFSDHLQGDEMGEIEKFMEGLAVEHNKLQDSMVRSSKATMKSAKNDIQERTDKRLEEINEQIENLKKGNKAGELGNIFGWIGKALAIVAITLLVATAAVASGGAAVTAGVGAAIAITFLIDAETGGNIMDGLSKGIAGAMWAFSGGKADFNELQKISQWMAMAAVIVVEIAAGGAAVGGALAGKLAKIGNAIAKTTVGQKAVQAADKVGSTVSKAGQAVKGAKAYKAGQDVVSKLDEGVDALKQGIKGGAESIDDATGKVVSQSVKGVKSAAKGAARMGEIAKESLQEVLHNIMKKIIGASRKMLQKEGLADDAMEKVAEQMEQITLTIVQGITTGVQTAEQAPNIGMGAVAAVRADIDKMTQLIEANITEHSKAIELSQRLIDYTTNNLQEFFDKNKDILVSIEQALGAIVQTKEQQVDNI